MSERILLLVVDVQKGFVNSHTEQIIKPIVKLTDQWKVKRYGPVVYSRFVNLPGSPWRRYMGWDNLSHEPETAIHSDLVVSSPYILKKSTYSAWSPELQQICSGEHIQTIAICGIDTDQCVLATAIDIFDANLRPLLLKDCCASSAGNAFHEMGIKLLERLVGKDQIISTTKLPAIVGD